MVCECDKSNNYNRINLVQDIEFLLRYRHLQVYPLITRLISFDSKIVQRNDIDEKLSLLKIMYDTRHGVKQLNFKCIYSRDKSIYS